MRGYFFLALSMFATTSNAGVFKCIAKGGKVIYQSQACASNSRQSELEITADPEAEAKAQANLHMIREEYEANKRHHQQQEKEAREKLEKAAQLEYARRSALAEQKQAEAQQRQAEALERRQSEEHFHPLWLAPGMTVVPPPTIAPKQPEPSSTNTLPHRPSRHSLR